MENGENHPNQQEIQSKLNGKTLMVYFVLLNKNSIGVRELQRHMGLSSPSVAKYHLDKLTGLHLASNTNGVYTLKNKAHIPALTSWVLLGKTLIPYSVGVALFFTLLFTGYMIGIFNFLNKDSLFVILFATLIIGWSWFDVVYQYRHKPF